jgi:hypothetical protein
MNTIDWGVAMEIRTQVLCEIVFEWSILHDHKCDSLTSGALISG